MMSLNPFSSRSLILLLLLSCAVSGYAQVTLTASSGTASGSFTTLKGAFDAINSGTHQGVIVVSIDASTTETSSAVLNASGSGSSSYTSISIFPTTSGLSISGSFAAPLIDLNGADNVTIDGRVNATGSTKSLTISNNSAVATAGTSTIRFIADASSNMVQYCTLKGSSTDAAAGIIFFSTATTTGNDNNTITNNDITSAADGSRPLNVVYASGTTAKNNDNNTISNNNIYNFLSKSTASQGINISSNNSGYTISGNSFYETASFTASAAVNYSVILISAATGLGNGFTVSGNFIGGSTALCGGTAWTKTAQNTAFTAISVTTATGTANSIQGNTIQNFNWTNAGASAFTGIYLSGATVANIGTVTGNTIGGATGTASITYTSNSANAGFIGINISSTDVVDCQNNTIGAITAANTTATSNTDFTGIYKSSSTGTTTIRNNTIGSTTTASSINASSVSTASIQSVYGIQSLGSGTLTFSGNTIANLVNATTNSGSAGLISGIYSRGGTNTISNNTVRDLSIANANTSVSFSASVTGISLSNLPTSAQTVMGNTVFNLSNSNASFAGAVVGIFYGGPNIVSSMSRNFIHSLSVTGASSSAAKLYGIKINAGATIYSNNIISLGGDTKTEVYGIYETGASNNNSLYFNTVYLSGSLPSGSTNNSYALYSNSNANTRDFRNNVLVNARSTSGASSKHYALYFSATSGTLTCDYNNYHVSGTGGVLGYYGSDRSSLPIVTSQDLNSITTHPAFFSTGTTASGYTPTVTGTGVAGTGITVDYDGNARGSSVTMGALQICINPTSGGTIATAQSGTTPFDPSAFTSTTAASGETGVIEYKWQFSTTSSSDGFNDIASSNSGTYDAGSLTQTTWYKRLARVTCKSDWTGAAESNVLEVTVVSSVTWNGSVSADWNTAANWTPAYVPTSGVGVVILASGSNTPVPPASVSLANLSLEAGKTLALGSGNLTLTGNLTNNGTVTSTSGKLSLAGSSLQTISGTGTIASLEVNNSAGVTITSGVGNMLSVTGTLTPTLGTLTTNGNLTLKSTASGTARVAQMPATGASIAGNVTVERYIPAGRKWRMLTAPVTGSSNNSIFYNWQNNGGTTGNNGVDIWGPGGSADPAAGNGLQTGPNPSMRSYSAGWQNVTDTKNSALFDANTNNAYAVFVSGPFKNGSVVVSTTTAAVATTLSATGNLITGTHTKTLSASPTVGQFFLVGNPYAAPVYVKDISGNNLTGTFYMWDAAEAGTNQLGKYVGYERTTGLYSTPTTGFPDSSTRLQSGQAFFVKADQPLVNTTITFEEADKALTSSNGMFGQSILTQYGMLRMTLQYESTGKRYNADGAVVLFYANGNPAIDRLDGTKLMNSGENLFMRRSNTSLMFEHRAEIQTTDTVFLRMSNMQQQSYRLQLEAKDLGVKEAYLIDPYTKKQIPVTLNGTTDIDFSVTSDSASTGDRFMVVFSRAAAPVVVIPDTDADAAGLKLYPNPVRNDLQVAVNVSMTGPYSIQVISGNGEPVWMRSGIASGTKRVAINTSGMVSGVYHLVLTDGQGGRMVKKFVKE